MREVTGVLLILLGGIGFFASVIAEISDGWIQNLQAWPWSIILGLAALLLISGFKFTFPEEATK